ncbi:MAG: hypothetical protein MJZ78_03110 [Bacteroidales bacterium]|nr:hypothetical protein [Bacteroidales bacterium]
MKDNYKMAHDGRKRNAGNVTVVFSSLKIFKIPNKVLLLCCELLKSAEIRCFLRTVIASKRHFPQNKNLKLHTNACGKANIVFVRNSLGGITDWFKGMVSLFDFCDRNNYNFRIYAKDKFDFNRFFVPNSYNWQMSDSEYENAENGLGAIHLWLSESGVKGSDTWGEQQYVLNKICRTNKVSNIFIHSVAPYGLPTFGKRFKELFKMTPYLNSVVEPMQKKLTPYMAVAFRFVNLLGDSDESVAGIDAIDKEVQINLINDCLNELKGLIEENASLSVLITTDSFRFLSYLDHDPVLKGKVNYLVGDKIHHHIGFSNEVTDAGITKSYAEFMLISTAEKVYQIQIGSMYESKFPKWAASINGRQYCVINK